MTTPATIVVPTYNESANVADLVGRLEAASDGQIAEIIFVDDSTDDTPAVIHAVARHAAVPVRVIHREHADGGLGGAVLVGLHSATTDVCVVMDGDLQHPPEDVPRLIREFELNGSDIVVASRYSGDGTAHGLAGFVRTGVSRLSTLVTKSMFPVRLRYCSDPMTGFFLVNRSAVDLGGLQPRGFKILLEILARETLKVSEIPFNFAERNAGDSKASLRQGLHFIAQLAALRFGKMSLFALIGAFGAVLNVGIVWALTQLGVNYIVAAIIAAEATIVGNFVLQERFVFGEMRANASNLGSRFAKSFAFNNAEAAVRIPVMAVLVETWHISSVVATAFTLAVAFFARFLFHSLVVYAPRRGVSSTSTNQQVAFERQMTGPTEL